MGNLQGLTMVEERVDGMRRLDRGRPIRAAMAARELTISGLAGRTRDLDPVSRGVNWRTIGFLISTGKSARDTCTVANAELIAEALDVPLPLLFEARITEVYLPVGISTQRRIIVGGPS